MLSLLMILFLTPWRTAARFFGVLVLVLLFAVPAYAQEAGGSGLSTMGIVGIVLAIAMSFIAILGSLWSTFVAYAARSEATWDNTFVQFVRGIAHQVVNEEAKSPLPTPTPAAK